MLLSLQEWNEKLASLAKERVSRCNSEPPNQNASSPGHIGWNTNMSAFGVSSFSEVIEGWFEEGKDFLFLSGKCKEGATCQHYTQVRPSDPRLRALLAALMALWRSSPVGVGHDQSGGVLQSAVSHRGRTPGNVCLRLFPWVTTPPTPPKDSSFFVVQMWMTSFSWFKYKNREYFTHTLHIHTNLKWDDCAYLL